MLNINSIIKEKGLSKKRLADKMGISVTFMAKLQEGGAGSSCHTHISLFKGNENIFNGNEDYGPVKGSKVSRPIIIWS